MRMTRSASLGLVAAAIAAPAAAIEISVDRIFDLYGSAKAIVSITNDDEHRGYKLIGIKCAFLDGGRAVASSGGVIENLAFGQTGTTEIGRQLVGAKFDSARCRVSYAYPR